MSMRSYYDKDGRKRVEWEEDSIIPLAKSLYSNDELKYWHETDDPHRIEASPPPDGGRLIYHDRTLIDGDHRIQILELMKHSRIEPDLIKSPNGKVKIVGMSVLPSTYRTLSLADLAEFKAVSINTREAPLTQAQIDRARQHMAQEINRSLEVAMLTGDPVKADAPPPQPVRMSALSRLMASARRLFSEIRAAFARDEDFDE